MEFLMNPFLVPDSSPWPCNSAMNFYSPAYRNPYRRPANMFGFEPMWMESPLSAPQPYPSQYHWRENPRYHPVYHDEPSDDDDDDDDDVSRSQRCSSLPTHCSRFSHPFQQSQVGNGYGQPFRNGQCPQQFKFNQRGQRNSCDGRNNSELVQSKRQLNKTRHNQGVKSEGRRSSKQSQQSNISDNLSDDRFNENTRDRMDVRSNSDASSRDCNSERPVAVVEPIVNEVQQSNANDNGEMKTNADTIKANEGDIEQTSNKNSASNITKSAENSGAVDQLNAAEKELAVIEERLNVFSGTRKDKEFIILDELITKLLLSLDAVESNGDESIRCKRKELVVRAQSCSDCLEKKSGGSVGEGRVREGDGDEKKDKEEQEMETIEDELRETFMKNCDSDSEYDDVES